MNELRIVNNREEDGVNGTTTERPPIIEDVEVQPAGGCPEFIWRADNHAQNDYEAMAMTLAESNDLFRSPQHGGGLILLLPNGKHVAIKKGTDLLPIIIDRVKLLVMKGGKITGNKIDSTHLNSMLKSERFLGQLAALDSVSAVPLYLPDFSLTVPGPNDGGPGYRILYTGENAEVSDSLETITKFLNVMAFDTNSDRTNAVAAALTVMLHNHWPGSKPLILVTATKSHAGKDTILTFAAGVNRSVSISYQGTNWAVERSFVGALKTNPDASLVVIENARLDGRDSVIASAFLERFVTDPEPQLFSTGTGPAVRVRNEYVLGISTNFGAVSEDLLNRALSIHLKPVGNVHDRETPIGNPRLEFLPAHQEIIAAELRGMIERWKKAGKPLDENVRHSFSPWAKVIGGILRESGFTDFLANHGRRKSFDDPIREGLAILGNERPDEWLRAAEWAKIAVDLGVVKKVITAGDRDSEAGRRRGMGKTLNRHAEETLELETEAEVVKMTVETKRARWDGSEPHPRYRFSIVERNELAS